MLKKITAVTALSTALFLSGAFHSSADASAKDQSQNLSYKQVYYSVNGKWMQLSNNNLEAFFAKCLPYFNWSNKVTNNQGEQEKPTEQAKPVENEKTSEQAKTEQTKPVEQAKPVEQNKPAQQTNTESNQSQNAQKPAQNNEQQATSNYQLSKYEQEVVELTNKERAKNGLSPLKADWELSRVAREKSRDMSVNNYFSHNSPVYGSPFDMMKNYGITYRTAGENIAKGQRTPQEVVNAWMNSEGHRANILNANFTHIGVGYVENGNHWTQQFIGK